LLLQSHKNVSDAASVDVKVFLALLVGNAGKIPNQAVVIDHNGSGRLNRRRSLNVDAHLVLHGLGANGFKPSRETHGRLLRKRQHRKRRKNKNRRFHSLDREILCCGNDRSFLSPSPSKKYGIDSN
jgi:hypothetical protein